MPDRAHIPNSPACGQWETLLADALDGLLKPEDESLFAEHMAGCQACTALFEEARRGREWLEFLSPEPEVPAGLLDKILAQTGPGQVSGYGLMAGNTKVLPMPPAWQRPGFAAQIRRFAEPRLLMTAAMAFFSIALTLNLTGVKLSGLRMADLRPTAWSGDSQRHLFRSSVITITCGLFTRWNRGCGNCGVAKAGKTRDRAPDSQDRAMQHRASQDRPPGAKTAARAWTHSNSQTSPRPDRQQGRPQTISVILKRLP